MDTLHKGDNDDDDDDDNNNNNNFSIKLLFGDVMSQEPSGS
jgi:hypothetical protein